MKKHLFTSLIFFTFLLGSNLVKAQCPSPSDNFKNFQKFDLTPTGPGDTVSNNSTWGGDFHNVQVVTGKTYVISGCKTNYAPDLTTTNSGWHRHTDTIGFDPAFTLMRDTISATVAQGPIVGYADSGCGSGSVMPMITYTATFTGDLAIVVDSVGKCLKFVVDSMTVFVTEINPSMTATIAADSNVTCNGLSNAGLSVSVSGGSTPYSYLWSNSDTNSSISGIGAGSYNVIVTDSLNKKDTAYFTVTQPASLSISAAADTNVSCFGGSNGVATATINGGTTGYSLLWGNSQTSSASGVASSGGGDTLLYHQSFEATSTDNLSFALDPATYNTEGDSIVDGSEDVWAVVQEFTNDIDTATHGLHFWGCQDLNNPNGGRSTFHYLTFSAADVSAFKNVKVDFSYFSDGFDTSDSLEYQVLFDSTSNFSNRGTALNKNTLVWDTVSVSVPDSAKYVRVRFQIKQDGSSDFSGWDDIRITGQPISSGGLTSQMNGLSAGSQSVIVTDTNGCKDTATFTITQPAAMVSSAVVDSNVSCNGSSTGGATASATGGTAPYNYAWSTSATVASINGVSSGTYYVTITDKNGCTDSSSAAITQPTALNASVSLDSNVSCGGLSDGSATASATGGTSGYTYMWSNSATTANASGLAAGNYIVTVTDSKMCTDTAHVSISQPTAVSASASVDSTASCPTSANGGATASGSGGTGTLTYKWSNAATTKSISGVLPVKYTVTVTDSKNCTDTASVTIGSNSTLVVSASVDSSVTCFGLSNGGASASATGGSTPFKYSWSNSDTTTSVVGLMAGTYYVTVTDGSSCTDSASVTITQPTKLVATATVDSSITCKGRTDGVASVSGSGGTTSYTYKWSTTATTTSINNLALGSYLVTVTDAKGCTDTDSIYVGYSGAYVPPSVSFPNPSASCNNASPITLSGATPTGGVYSGSNVASGDFLPASAGIGTDTLYYTYTDTIGCITVDTAYVVVNGAPTVTFSSLSKICADNGLQPVIGGMPTGGNYKGNGVYLNNFYPDSSGVGSHNITYVFTNTDNCTDSATQAQVVNALPIVSFGTQNNWCLNASPIKLNSGTPTGGSYTVNGVADTTYSSTKAGMDTIIYTFTDTNNCVNMDTAMIQADTVPVVTFSTLSDLCVGSANYTLVEGMPNANGTGMYSGNRVSAGKYSPSMVTTDTLTYMFTDSNNCMSNATQTITVNALPVVAISSQAAICENTPSFALSGGTPTGGTYSGGGVSSGNYDASSFGTGTDNIKYVYSDGNNCKDSAMTTLVVNAVTKATLQFLGYTCNNTEVKNLTSSGIPVGGTFSGSGVSGTDFDPKVAGTGTHSISYVYTNTKNCQDSAKGDIIVEAAPVFNIEGDSVGCGTGIDAPLLKVNLAGMTYRWSNGSTSDTAIVTQNGKAWVKVIDPATQRLCFNTDTIIVKYDEVCVGLDENLSETKVNYYPNPNNGSFNYAVEGFNGMDVTVKVITANGQEVYRDVWNNVSDRTGEIHMDVMESGLYFIHLSTTKGSVVHRLEIVR